MYKEMPYFYFLLSQCISTRENVNCVDKILLLISTFDIEKHLYKKN